MDNAPIVKVRDLAFSYAGKAALRAVSFEVAKGEIFGLLGPNGGGKTTVFRCLSTLLAPQAQQATVCGHDVATDPVAVRGKIGVVFQSPSLDRKLTVMENLRHQGHLYGLRGAELRERIDQILDRFDLADRARDRVETLSGGLERRVEVAKGILHRPSILILDEPTSHLDPVARRDLWLVLRELRDDGVTILLTTHLMDEAERCDRVAILDRGEVIACGAPERMKSEVRDVIRIESQDPEGLCAGIRERFGGEATVVDGTIRIEREGGQSFAAELLQAFPGRIDSFSFGKPTLEDVYFRRTGHAFLDGNSERGPGAVGGP